jgi:hypothetical protein
VPGLLHVDPNDWEFYGLGKIEGSEPRLPCEPDKRVEPCGLNRLRGPGAWAKCEPVEEPPAPAKAPCDRK